MLYESIVENSPAPCTVELRGPHTVHVDFSG